MQNSCSSTEVTISHKIVNKNLKHMAVTQPRSTHILYQCAKFGDDRTSFNVICDVCDVYHVKSLCPYFDISAVKSVSHDKVMIFERP